MHTKGFARLGPFLGISSAMTSFPVPVSLVIRTLLSVAAIFPMEALMDQMAGLAPTISFPAERPAAGPGVGSEGAAGGLGEQSLDGVRDVHDREG
jgi:hypothetical protein